MSIVQMELDPDQAISSGFVVDAGQSLVSPPTKEGGVRCRFRSCYPVKLWPLRVAITGKKASPGVFEVMAVLGKEKVLVRVEQALRYLKKI